MLFNTWPIAPIPSVAFYMADSGRLYGDATLSSPVFIETIYLVTSGWKKFSYNLGGGDVDTRSPR